MNQCVRVLNTFTYADKHVSQGRDREHEAVYMVQNNKKPVAFKTSSKFCGKDAPYIISNSSYCLECAQNKIAPGVNWVSA